MGQVCEVFEPEKMKQQWVSSGKNWGGGAGGRLRLGDTLELPNYS